FRFSPFPYHPLWANRPTEYTLTSPSVSESGVRIHQLSNALNRDGGLSHPLRILHKLDGNQLSICIESWK
ncbi:8249_t:CDS:1, partial [Dentiscutata erythropus]